MVLTQWETLCGLFFAFFEKIVVPILTSGGLAAVTSSFFAALYSAFGKYDVVHIHAEGPAFFSWLPKMFGKRVVVTIHGIDWQREKWQSGLGSKFIHQGEKNAVKYADEVIVLSKGVQDYFKETYGRKTHFIPNGVNRPQTREANLITDKFGLKKDSYILFLGRLVPEKGIRYLVEAFKNVKRCFNAKQMGCCTAAAAKLPRKRSFRMAKNCLGVTAIRLNAGAGRLQGKSKRKKNVQGCITRRCSG